jgi:hypothetical protein
MRASEARNFGSELLWLCLVSKIFQDFPSHRMFRHMYGALNIDGKKTNYTVW